MFAPIIVFAYNRPNHLQKVLSALSKNQEAKKSNLYLFIDGPKNMEDSAKTKEVIRVAEHFSEGYFQKVELSVSKTNKGLAKSVITGVSQIIDVYGRVIVTEDDSIPSYNYLSFMNAALDYYANDKNIWSIGGYTVPMHLPENYASDVILTQRSSSYAWATWNDRWKKIDWEIHDYSKLRWDFSQRKKFNAWGDDRASMLDDQMNGRVNSWAIRFDYAMFKNGMYNIIPRESLIQNIGHDGSGTHSTVAACAHDPFQTDISKPKKEIRLESVSVQEEIRQEFCKPFASGKLQLMKRWLGNLFLYRRKR